MGIIEFLGIGIVGVIISLIISVLKKKFGGLKSDATKAFLVLLALIVGAGFYFLQGSPYVESVFTILGFASLAYSFFLKK